jgi:hypothetical protein
MVDGEELAESGPQLRGELRAPVTYDGGRNAKSLNPALELCGCAVGGGDGGEQKSFWPPCSPVNHGKQVGETG